MGTAVSPLPASGEREKLATPSLPSQAPTLLLRPVHARRETKVQVAGFQGVFVRAQCRIVGGLRHTEVRRQSAVEQAGTLQVVEARKVAERFQAEMAEEVRCRAVGQ